MANKNLKMLGNKLFNGSKLLVTLKGNEFVANTTNVAELFGNVSADADGVGYDNTTSGLIATDVQNAIDELHEEVEDILTMITNINETLTNINETLNAEAEAEEE